MKDDVFLTPGSEACDYMACAFCLAMKASGLSTSGAKAAFKMSAIPALTGQRVPSSATMRAHQICEYFTAHAPEIMERPEIGGVLTAYQSGVLATDLFSDAIVDILRATNQTFKNVHDLSTKRNAAFLALYDIKKTQAPKIKSKKVQADPLDTRPPESTTELLALAHFKFDADGRIKWNRMQPAERNRTIREMSEQLGRTSIENQYGLWSAASSLYLSRVKPECADLPMAGLRTVLDEAGVDPAATRPPDNSALREAYYLLKFRPKG